MNGDEEAVEEVEGREVSRQPPLADPTPAVPPKPNGRYAVLRYVSGSCISMVPKVKVSRLIPRVFVRSSAVLLSFNGAVSNHYTVVTVVLPT